MADVFLSYAREDRAVAERLAGAIEAAGRSVWWDRHIKGGAEFSKDIEQQLDAAKFVLVLWSKAAIGSRWVRDEASEAVERGKLVATSIDGTAPPLGFRQFHTIDLRGWTRKGAALPRDLADALDTPSGEVSPNPATGPRRNRRWLLAAIALALLVIGAGAVFVLTQGNPFARQDRQSVGLAVMPFAAPAGEKAFLGPGLAGALSNGLSRLSGLRIISITSTLAVADQDLTARQIGEQLKVSHLVEGEIRPEGDRLRIDVRLIDTKTSEQLWTETYREVAADLGALQEKLSTDLAAALQARLGIGQDFQADRSSVDPRAYEAYLKGIERITRRHDTRARVEAHDFFQLAASIQPDFADAHAGAAYILSLSVPPQLSMSWDELKAAQRKANRAALMLDPDNLLALVARSNAAYNFDGDIDSSFADARRVLAIAPDFGPAHYALGSTYGLAGDPRAAVPHFDQAVESDPFNKTLRNFRQINRYLMGDYQAVRDEALECQTDCEPFIFAWFEALLAYGTPMDFDRDFKHIHEKQRLFADQATEDELNEFGTIARFLVLGEKGTIGPPPPEARSFSYASILAQMGQVDAGFRVAAFTAPRSQSDEITTIMTGGRLDFPPHLRADPRYHALFRDHPNLQRVADYRRRHGVLDGLPIAPSQIEAERRRLAAMRR